MMQCGYLIFTGKQIGWLITQLSLVISLILVFIILMLLHGSALLCYGRILQGSTFLGLFQLSLGCDLPSSEKNMMQCIYNTNFINFFFFFFPNLKIKMQLQKHLFLGTPPTVAQKKLWFKLLQIDLDSDQLILFLD